MDFGNGRALAYTVKINHIRPHIDVTRTKIEIAHINGWQCVVRRGEFTEGETAVFCEVDSFVPHEIAPYLTKPGKEPSVYAGVRGERIKMVDMFGEKSQGLLLKASIAGEGLVPNIDVTDRLGIVKWDEGQNLSGHHEFPRFIPVSDAERVQNLDAEVLVELFVKKNLYYGWHISEKLDGMSSTMYLRNGEFHICSHHQELHTNDYNIPQVKWARAFGMENFMRKHNLDGFALQGELIGQGIQKNPYNLDGLSFCLFGVYDINNQKYARIADFGFTDLEHYNYTFRVIPSKVVSLSPNIGSEEIRDALNEFGTDRFMREQFGSPYDVHEGVVFKSAMYPKWLKCINDDYVMEKKYIKKKKNTCSNDAIRAEMVM